MDTSNPEPPSMELICATLLELKAKMLEKEGPRPRINRAPWRNKLSLLEDLVIKQGYVRYHDAEQLGFNNTEWDRATSALIGSHPKWKKVNVKHRKFLHRPDVDIQQLVLEDLAYHNYSSNNPKVLEHMVMRILRAGRLNVLDDLQKNQPMTGEKWRNQFLDNLAKHIKNHRYPIQREMMNDRRIPTPSDWFSKKEN
ncbi:MAG: hypothetical protein AB9819_07385 [Methanomassiliicoccales archaeon]